MSRAWNLADLFELVADTAPDRLALAHDPEGPTRTWAELDRRSDALARGFVARSGPIPEGYYKDEKKTAETFRTIQGRRGSIPGDWCTVNADGTLNLLGRGSVCINTGGEKVYPEEVEEAFKLHEAVADAVVVGLADEKWGEAVTALVQLRPAAAADEEPLRGFVRERLAGYKAPKRVVLVDDVGRSPSGKVDYKGAKARAREALGLPA